MYGRVPWCAVKTQLLKCAPAATRKRTGNMCSWTALGGKPRTGSCHNGSKKAEPKAQDRCGPEASHPSRNGRYTLCRRMSPFLRVYGQTKSPSATRSSCMAQMPVEAPTRQTPDSGKWPMPYAVVACKKQGNEYVQVGAFVGQVPGAQTLARYTEGPVDTTLDCLGVRKQVRSPKPGKTHGDIWWRLQTTDVNRLKMKWVPSHVSEKEFLQKVGAENLWRQQVNDLADKVWEKSGRIGPPRPDCQSVRGPLQQKGLRVPGSRAEKILTAVGKNQHPVYKVFLQEKQARKNGAATFRPQKAHRVQHWERPPYHPARMVPGAGPDQTCACVGMGRSQPPVCSVST